MSNDKPVRLGVVGLGFMGGVHAQNTESAGHEVVAGVDISPEARDAFADSYGVNVYADVEDMLDAETLDAVAVSTPNAYHEPAVVPALERDIAVFCEKPLAHELPSAERIVAAATESDAFCMVNFHNRVSTAAEVFCGYRDAGMLGEVYHVEANYIRRRGIPGVGSWFTTADLSGGGAVVDIGVHAIDFALYLMGYPDVKDVFAVTRSDFGTDDEYVDPGDWYEPTDEAVFDVEDAVTATIRCADDRTISLEVTWAANQPESNQFVARGTEAGATMPLGGESITFHQAGKQGTDHLLDAELADGKIEHTGWEGSDRRFLKAVQAGSPPPLHTAAEALTVQRVIDAIYRSSQEGKSVKVE